MEKNTLTEGNSKAEDLLRYDRLVTVIGAYKHHKPCMIKPDDWGQGKNCILFNNVPDDADDPEFRNLRQTGIYGMRLTSGQQSITISRS